MNADERCRNARPASGSEDSREGLATRKRPRVNVPDTVPFPKDRSLMLLASARGDDFLPVQAVTSMMETETWLKAGDHLLANGRIS